MFRTRLANLSVGWRLTPFCSVFLVTRIESNAIQVPVNLQLSSHKLHVHLIINVHLIIIVDYFVMTTEVTVVPPTKRGASFSELEQTSLTQAWIEVSLDPIHGNDQKGTEFYRKVSDSFKEKMGTMYTIRSQDSLHAHWRDNIQHNVSKFSSAFNKATSKVISGYSSNDYLRDAQVLYMAESKAKKPFKLMHCWEILKCHSKWSPSRSESPDDVAPTLGPVLDRPMGCHTAKKAKIEGKAKAKEDTEKRNQLKQAIEAIESNNLERREMASKGFSLVEKSSALKELKFFESDTSEEGRMISKQLRANYIKKYVSMSADNVSQMINTPPMIDTTPTIYTPSMIDMAPTINTQSTIDTATADIASSVYATPLVNGVTTMNTTVNEMSKTLNYEL